MRDRYIVSVRPRSFESLMSHSSDSTVPSDPEATPDTPLSSLGPPRQALAVNPPSPAKAGWDATTDFGSTDDRGEPPAAAKTESVQGESIGSYDILSELGRGGMGVVYKAQDRRLKRLVALKVVLAGRHAGGAERDRFQIEVEAAARLQHPNIVQVYEVGEDGGR